MRRAPLITALLVLLIAGFGVYWNSLQGSFVLDDWVSITDNPNLRSFLPLSESLTGPPGSCQSGRPLAALSLALNYAIGGYEVVGYHLFNVGLHLAAALALFGLVRRTASFTALAPHALALAFAVASIWVLHPLHTDALNHVSYRTETMMALFYLLTLYGAARGLGTEGKSRWLVLSVVSCFLAMASKEVAVSAPLLVLCWDRQFRSGTFRAALRRRKGYYLALFSSWVLLALCVLWAERGETVGFEFERVGSHDYLRTQAGVIVHYLRLSFWPHPLVFDYFDGPLVRSWSEVWLQASIVLSLFVATLVGLRRRRPWSVPALLFFAVLAPTSSFIPLAGELAAEHRMVLPLAAVATLSVLAVARLSSALPSRPRRLLTSTLVVAVALCLGARTVARNRDYRTEEILWRDTLDKRPENDRANHCLVRLAMKRGDHEEAEVLLRNSVELRPGAARTWSSLGSVLTQNRKYGEAEQAYRRALEISSEQVSTHQNLAQLYLRWNRPAQAVGALREVLRLEPNSPSTAQTLAWILATSKDDGVRDGPQALRLARAFCAGSSPPPVSLEVLAAALAEMGQFPEAVRVSEQAAGSADRAGRRELAERIRDRQRGYATGRPWRE